MVLIAVYCLNVAHPGPVFGGDVRISETEIAERKAESEGPLAE